MVGYIERDAECREGGREKDMVGERGGGRNGKKETKGGREI